MDTKRSVFVRRVTGFKRVGLSTLKGQVAHIVNRALAGSRSNWKLHDQKIATPYQDKGRWNYEVTFTFEKSSQRNASLTMVESQWKEILRVVGDAGGASRYSPYYWEIVPGGVEFSREASEPEVENNPESEPKIEIEYYTRVNVAARVPEQELDTEEEENLPIIVKTPAQLREEFPVHLLKATDQQIENHPAFQGIYGRGPHIRILLHAIYGAILSDFTVTNHALLYGLPACAKSQIFTAIERLLGEGATLSLDAPSTTKAGIERLFLKTYRDNYPRIIFLQEIDKVNELALPVWLPIMDDRRQIIKTNNKGRDTVKVNALILADCNDRVALDKIMGGSARKPGALSSRFVNQLHVPRPSRSEMRRILFRELKAMELRGEKTEDLWVDECIQLMDDIKDLNLVSTNKVSDPRWIKSWLDGRNRLVTGEYQDDLISILKIETLASQEGEFDKDEVEDILASRESYDIPPSPKNKKR